ncbi:hypothetical protein BV25DRAFT_1831394 [Artomyces pyxidatus]|uniref:Uncharacterized protein n=1 Tax=Artomyces pyxidatus TaxID=48021 RepID=A0ACB8SLI6_9AGAM|nr:hypothetical protein BV25DRAFT_1831394 [Artomyces pyxidatus]
MAKNSKSYLLQHHSQAASEAPACTLSGTMSDSGSVTDSSTIRTSAGSVFRISEGPASRLSGRTSDSGSVTDSSATRGAAASARGTVSGSPSADRKA